MATEELVRDPATLRLEGERIYLRMLRLEDVNETYLRWMNDPDVIRYLECRFSPPSLDQLRNYVISKLGDLEHVFLAIVLKRDNRHIGNIKLGPIHAIHKFSELGLLIGEKNCWGKGYATEALRLAVEYAFRELGLRKLTAGCYATNTASMKLFQDAGFVVEGVRRNQYLLGESYVDAVFFGRFTTRTES